MLKKSQMKENFAGDALAHQLINLSCLIVLQLAVMLGPDDFTHNILFREKNGKAVNPQLSGEWENDISHSGAEKGSLTNRPLCQSGPRIKIGSPQKLALSKSAP